jgi:tellurite resistance protein TerC
MLSEFFVLETLWLGKPAWMWLGFLTLVGLLLLVDLGLLHRGEREIGVGESLRLSAGYITLGLLFGGWVWWQLGADAGLSYVTGFLIEKSLAMDNVFVIAMIFGALSIPRRYQHRVLFWGILGVILLRGVMIGLGSALVERFEWMLYLFAAILVVTGLRMWREAARPHDGKEPPLLSWLRRHLPVTGQLHGQRFLVRVPSRPGGPPAWQMTPLLLALILVEMADILFALDSVPAIFAITTDPFIVYTSNIFAILGLRALYFALAAMVDRFHYLKYALSLLLIFIGGKILAADALGLAKIPAPIALAITALILGGGIGWSLWKTRPQQPRPAGGA